MNCRFTFAVLVGGLCLAGCHRRTGSAASEAEGGQIHTSAGRKAEDGPFVNVSTRSGTVIPTIQMDWPELPSDSLSPGTALSVRVVLRGAGAGKSDVVIDGDRSTDTNAHTQAYHGAELAAVGSCGLDATYYSAAGLSGTVVATTSADVAVSNDGSITNPDGTQLSPFAFRYPQGATATAPPLPERPSAPSSMASAERPAPNPPRTGSAVSTEPPLIAYQRPPRPHSGSSRATEESTLAPPVFAASDFVNSGFEDSRIPPDSHTRGGPPGFSWGGQFTYGAWGVANGSGSWGHAAHTGNQYAFVQRGGSITQTLTGLVKGHRYQVVFWMMRRNGDVGGNAPTPLTVTLNSTRIFGPYPPPDRDSWLQFVTDVFVADGKPATFEFATPAGGMDAADLLDDIHVIPAQH